MHGIGQLGHNSAMGAHLLRKTIHWIAKNIHKGMSLMQVMKKHKE